MIAIQPKIAINSEEKILIKGKAQMKIVEKLKFLWFSKIPKFIWNNNGTLWSFLCFLFFLSRSTVFGQCWNWYFYLTSGRHKDNVFCCHVTARFSTFHIPCCSVSKRHKVTYYWLKLSWNYSAYYVKGSHLVLSWTYV